MVDPVGGADYNTGANADSASLAWSSGTEVPDLQGAPPGGVPEDAAAQAPVGEQSWGTVWGRSLAVLLICLGAATVIVVVGLVLMKGNSPDAAPARTSAAPTAPVITTAIVSDPDQDSRYIAALNEKGIVFANPDVAVSNGKAVCQSFAAKMTVAQVVAQFRASSPDFSDHAEDIVAVSVRAYCPQYSKLVAGM